MEELNPSQTQEITETKEIKKPRRRASKKTTANTAKNKAMSKNASSENNDAPDIVGNIDANSNVASTPKLAVENNSNNNASNAVNDASSENSANLASEKKAVAKPKPRATKPRQNIAKKAKSAENSNAENSNAENSKNANETIAAKPNNIKASTSINEVKADAPIISNEATSDDTEILSNNEPKAKKTASANRNKRQAKQRVALPEFSASDSALATIEQSPTEKALSENSTHDNSVSNQAITNIIKENISNDKPNANFAKQEQNLAIEAQSQEEIAEKNPALIATDEAQKAPSKKRTRRSRKNNKSRNASNMLDQTSPSQANTDSIATTDSSDKSQNSANKADELELEQKNDAIPMLSASIPLQAAAIPMPSVEDSLQNIEQAQDESSSSQDIESTEQVQATEDTESSGGDSKSKRKKRKKKKAVQVELKSHEISISASTNLLLLKPEDNLLKPISVLAHEATPPRIVNEAAESQESEQTSENETPSGRRLVVSVQPGEQMELIILEHGVVKEYYIEMANQQKIRGNIYKGVISNIDTNLQAAFVNYGAAKNGFLQIDEVHPEYYLSEVDTPKGQKFPPIQKILKPGQEILVQIGKEPTGNKGAFLSTWLSLAGRFIVLMPGQEQIGISRKVEDGKERDRLREMIKGLNPGEGFGAIVRTLSEGVTKATLQKDLNYLKRLWKEIRKKGQIEQAPVLIYKEPSLAERAIRDYLTDDIEEVWIDDAEMAKAMQETAELLFPRKQNLIKYYDNPRQSLLEHFDVLRQIEQIHSREYVMPSGACLVFDQTEALMAIDINSGKNSGKNNFEALAYKTNLEAAEHIARQLRLRDIGGQVVIDFIEMKDRKQVRDVEKTMRNCMKSDRARHDIGNISEFGLMQLVRQRTGSSAISISSETCPFCQGTGTRRNLEWQALQSLRDLQIKMRDARRAEQSGLVYTVDPELAIYLLNSKRERLANLEKEYDISLEIRPAKL